jgi:hypothetical protein
MDARFQTKYKQAQSLIQSTIDITIDLNEWFKYMFNIISEHADFTNVAQTSH